MDKTVQQMILRTLPFYNSMSNGMLADLMNLIIYH